MPVSAVDSTLEGYNPYHGWEFEDASKLDVAVFPVVTIEPKDESGSSSLSLPKAKASSSGSWVTISPFSAEIGGSATNLIAGYLSGERNGATITIAGKKNADSDFSDLATIKPDENGLFIWAVPAASKSLDLFRVTADAGGSPVISNAIRFSGSSADPVVRPVVSPAQAPIPMMTSEKKSSEFSQSSLSIRASSTSPAVGTDITITGKLVDGKGKGISGATVSIDETGYPDAAGAEPFDSTQTGSDGSFTFTIQVASANMVGLVAHYDGDGTHSSAESNTIIFSSHE